MANTNTRRRFKFKLFSEQQKKEIASATKEWWLEVVGFIPTEIHKVTERRYKLYTTKSTQNEIFQK
jgi:hypothetical protein